MTTAPAGDATVPLHRRTLEYEAFDVDGSLRVVGRLRDERPWATGGPAVVLLHDMELSVTVALDGLTITEAGATMHAFPHAECPAVVVAFAGLAGLDVARGYTGRVQRLFGGPRGCAHLEHLARSLGPVVVQAVTSRRARATAAGEAVDVTTVTGSPFARDTCHVWVEDGPAERKLAAGWRPGAGPYPAPPVADVVARDGAR